jgi:hemolysin activation/secretion protein
MISVLLADGHLVFAQNNLPPAGQDLEAQAERFRQEYSLSKRLLEIQKEKPSIEFQKTQAPPVVGGTVFELREIRLTGVSPKDEKILDYIWKPYIGQKVSMNDLQKVVDHLTKVYNDAGYLTSMAYLPAQDIKDGIVEIKMVEGKRGHLTIEGNRWFNKASIAQYFHTDRDEILNLYKVQKDIIRLNENPDLSVKTVLSTGEAPGTTDVILKVKDHYPHHVSVGFDNQGTRLVGRYRETLTVNSTNFTGHQDLMYFTTLHTSLSTGQYMSYRLPVGTHGFKAGLDLGYFEIKLGKEFKPLDITGNTKIYTPNASWELYHSENVQANYSAGVKIKDIKKKERNLKITDEQLRLPYLGIDVTRLDSSGQTSFAPEISLGTSGFLGASTSNNPLASRTGTGGFFTKYEHSFNRIQKMPWDSYMDIKSQFQAASHTLPSSEQFQLGGESSIRGYSEGDYMADLGGNLRMDWIFPMYFIPNKSLQHQIEPVIFADVGGGRLLKALPGETKDKFLAGVGGGLRIHIKGHAYLKLEWADHVGNKPIRGTGPSTFSVSLQFNS